MDIQHDQQQNQLPGGITDQIVVVASYTNFDNLAHQPHGTPSPFGLYVYRLFESGNMVLLHVYKECENPAFLRKHPTKNIIYACTESIHNNGSILAFSISQATGKLKLISERCAEGTSTCYIWIDRTMENMLITNYWDSSISILPINTDGTLETVSHQWRPEKEVIAEKRDDHLTNRQSEPHSHAIVLDPFMGKVAYVPDLGEDVIRQFIFDPDLGLQYSQSIKVSNQSTPQGPRYIEFHPSLNCAYVVNELASTITVFEFDTVRASLLKACDPVSTLTNLQEISTIPMAFPRDLNTCGRITVDPTGNYVLVSNRGHNSIAVFGVSLSHGGVLGLVGIFHTGGRTPRHFQFDVTGNFLLVANQDTGNVTVFRFDKETGKIETESDYDVPAPNFIAVLPGFSNWRSAL